MAVIQSRGVADLKRPLSKGITVSNKAKGRPKAIHILLSKSARLLWQEFAAAFASLGGSLSPLPPFAHKLLVSRVEIRLSAMVLGYHLEVRRNARYVCDKAWSNFRCWWIRTLYSDLLGNKWGNKDDRAIKLAILFQPFIDKAMSEKEARRLERAVRGLYKVDHKVGYQAKPNRHGNMQDSSKRVGTFSARRNA